MGLNSELFNTNGRRVATSSNNRMAVRCTGIYEKQENGEYIEVVNWENDIGIGAGLIFMIVHGRHIGAFRAIAPQKYGMNGVGFRRNIV